MTLPKQSPCDIEEQLVRDRAALAQSVAALRNRISGDHMLTGLLTANPAPIGRALITTVRDHPVAAALAGAGLAWALFGRKQPVEVAGNDLSGTKYEALSRWEDEGGPGVPLEEPDLNWLAEAESLRNRASAALAALESKARERFASAADLAQERAAVLAALAKDVRQSMRSGLDHLTAAAQDQIVAAREAAYATQLSARKATGKAIVDHPFAAAGLALAVGAAIGLSLPRTRTEDRVLGPERDRLLAEARRLLAEERLRASAAMDALSSGR